MEDLRAKVESIRSQLRLHNYRYYVLMTPVSRMQNMIVCCVNWRT